MIYLALVSLSLCGGKRLNLEKLKKHTKIRNFKQARLRGEQHTFNTSVEEMHGVFLMEVYLSIILS